MNKEICTLCFENKAYYQEYNPYFFSTRHHLSMLYLWLLLFAVMFSEVTLENEHFLSLNDLLSVAIITILAIDHHHVFSRP